VRCRWSGDNVTFLMTKSLDPFRFLRIAVCSSMNQQQLQLIDYLLEENQVRREQLGPKRLRFNHDSAAGCPPGPRDSEASFSERWLRWSRPKTLLAWHRRLIAQKYDGSSERMRRTDKIRGDRGSGGAHGERNRSWGDRRIQRALSNLGHEVGRGTIAEMLSRQGIDPAPEQERKTTWKDFLAQHWDLIVAADVFPVEAWTQRRLQRFITCFSWNCRPARWRLLGSRQVPVGCG
jgi:putative transposase